MPIQSYGYLSNGNAWREYSSSTQGNNRVASEHAERRVLRELKNRQPDVCLIVQNAFPCGECHASFLQESHSTSIIIKVTANEGRYSLDHNLSATASVPCVMYYHAGEMALVGLWSRSNGDAPHGFPAHPDFAHIE